MKSLEELRAIRDRAKNGVHLRKENSPDAIRVIVGMATCGIAAGARPVLTAFTNEVAKRDLQNVMITQTGCIGLCQYEPIVEVYQPDGKVTTYVKMNADKVGRIVTEHLVNGNVVDEYTIGSLGKLK